MKPTPATPKRGAIAPRYFEQLQKKTNLKDINNIIKKIKRLYKDISDDIRSKKLQLYAMMEAIKTTLKNNLMKKKTRFFPVFFAVIFSALLTQELSAFERGLSVVPIKNAANKQVVLYQESHALVIGASEYTNGWPKLPGVKNDIEAVKSALEKNGFHVETVIDPDNQQLQKAFTDFINRYGFKPENRLLFYFAGHGHTLRLDYGDEMGYIVPINAPNPNVDKNGFLSLALDMQQMEVFAKRIQAKHALFLFDSCFAGSIFALSRAVPENISYKTAKPVRQFITSGGAEEKVPDKSIFRRQFIAALAGEGDGNRDGYLTGLELGEFLQAKVTNYSKGAQHPQYGKIRNPNLDKGDYVFLLSPDSTASTAPVEQQRTTETDLTAFELSFWETIQGSKNPEDFKAYIQEYPNGRFATLARIRSQSTPKKAKPLFPDLEVIQTKTTDYGLSFTDYANVTGELEFDVGLGNSMWGYGFAGAEICNASILKVKVTAPSHYKHFDANAFAGFIVDYYVKNRYVKRVMLGIGMLDQQRWDGVPRWGHPQKLQLFLDLGHSESYSINLKKWAPKGWDGQIWFTVGIQNAGHNGSIQAKVTADVESLGKEKKF